MSHCLAVPPSSAGGGHYVDPSCYVNHGPSLRKGPLTSVGRIVLYPEPTGIRLGMCGQGVLTSWVHHPMPSSGAGGRTGSRQTCPIVWQCHQVDNEIRRKSISPGPYHVPDH